MGYSHYDAATRGRAAWDAGKTVGAKRPLTQKQLWAIRFAETPEGAAGGISFVVTRVRGLAGGAIVAEKSGIDGALPIDMAATKRVPARGEELVLVVMRFEYALKEIGYGKKGAGGVVEAKWDEFANTELTSDFLKHVRENNIAPTILSRPPSKQILNGSSLAWKETAAPTCVQSLFGSVRRVRNNLVHGGKSGDEDSDRNDLLVAEAIAVLIEALRAHADLRAMFEGKW